jgi:phage terminase small subunit
VDVGQTKPARAYKLTAKQQAFVAYKLAHPGATDAEAARAAGYSPTDSGIASKTANHPAVVAALQAHTALVMAQASLSREGHLNELERLREKAIEAGQLSAAITAEVHRGKVGGYYEDKVRLITDRINKMSPAELDAAADALGIE